MPPYSRRPSLKSRRLEVFLAIAEERSITRASARLALSQPAVTRELRLLERELGTELFDRLPRGVRLTESGELLLQHVRKLVTVENDALETLSELGQLGRGEILLAASNTIGNYILPRVIVAFHRAHPRVAITVRIVNSREVLHLLDAEEIGLGFIETLSEPGKELAVETLARDVLVPVAASSHPLARSSRLSSRDILGQIFLLREEGSGIREAVHARLRRLGLVPPDTLTLGTTEAIKDVLLGGVGVSVLPERAVSAEVASGRLIVLSLPKLRIERELYWVHRRRRRLGAAPAAFLDMLRATAGVAALGTPPSRSPPPA